MCPSPKIDEVKASIDPENTGMVEWYIRLQYWYGRILYVSGN